MPRTTVKALTDRTIEGGLEAWLRDRRLNDRESMGSMAQLLQSDFEIIVTPETVRLWCHQYGIPTERLDPEPEPVDAP